MELGTQIGGRFELLSPVKTGGMGTIYRARDTQRGGLAAVKLLYGLQEGLTARFVRESQVLASLKHPGIVRHLAHGQAEGGAHYLAMEWLQGRDLQARVDEGPLSTTEALTLLRGVAEAVAHAHSHGVVHRDLKPSNIFLVDDAVDHIKVLDFGIAALTQPHSQALTRTGVAIGTPGYMAPEQARGEREVDARADVYAMGCVLFHALSGRGPGRLIRGRALALKAHKDSVTEQGFEVAAVLFGDMLGLPALALEGLARARDLGLSGDGLRVAASRS